MKFLGSIWFTLILLISVALFTIAGTFIESTHQSHKLASKFIYSNPLFLLLLGGFFVNILISLLLRYPFKSRHIPFILAHIGLLMVIGGTILKVKFGDQGFIRIKEGREVDFFYLDDTEGLTLKTRGSKLASIPLNPKNLLAYFPHSRSQNELWFKKGGVQLFNHPLLPLNEPQKLRSEYTAIALREDLEALAKANVKPLVVFYKNKEGIETVVAINSKGESVYEDYDPSALTQIYAYDEGYKGFGVAFNFFGEEIESPLTQILEPASPPLKPEDARPLILYRFDKETVPLQFKNPLPTRVKNSLIAFEEQRKNLPFTVRLRQASSHYYPNTQKPSHYEAKVYINKLPVTLSMNHVYESLEGYRLYLSNISPMDESKVKEVQLAINYDPFKYKLTYPGAIILTLGIMALFFIRRRPV